MLAIEPPGILPGLCSNGPSGRPIRRASASAAAERLIFIALNGRRFPAQGESLGLPAEGVMLIGLKGRRFPAQGESLGLPAVRRTLIGLKGRGFPAQGESLGIEGRNSHGFSTQSIRILTLCR